MQPTRLQLGLVESSSPHTFPPHFTDQETEAHREETLSITKEQKPNEKFLPVQLDHAQDVWRGGSRRLGVWQSGQGRRERNARPGGSRQRGWLGREVGATLPGGPPKALMPGSNVGTACSSLAPVRPFPFSRRRKKPGPCRLPGGHTLSSPSVAGRQGPGPMSPSNVWSPRPWSSLGLLTQESARIGLERPDPEQDLAGSGRAEEVTERTAGALPVSPLLPFLGLV